MAFELPPLPNHNALAERGMCRETLELHHGKHHQAYVTALNSLVEKNAELQGKTLEEVVKLAHSKAGMAAVFNNAGQHWNHILFWQNMSPSGGGIPGKLEKKLAEDFGRCRRSRTSSGGQAVQQFGSGWAWLVLGTDGKLKTTKTPNGSNPLVTGEGKVLLAAMCGSTRTTSTSATAGRTTSTTGSTRSPTTSSPKRGCNRETLALPRLRRGRVMVISSRDHWRPAA